MIVMVVTDVIPTEILEGCKISRKPVLVSEDFFIDAMFNSDVILIDTSSKEVVEWMAEIVEMVAGKPESDEELRLRVDNPVEWMMHALEDRIKIMELKKYDCEVMGADYLFTFLTGIRQIISWEVM